jgi:hypothetical protein
MGFLGWSWRRIVTLLDLLLLLTFAQNKPSESGKARHRGKMRADIIVFSLSLRTLGIRDIKLKHYLFIFV